MQLERTLYITSHRAKLSMRKRNLLVDDPDADGPVRVPIETIDAVVLTGAAQVTHQAMSACTKRGVAITALNRSGRVKFRVRGGTIGNVQLRLAQFDAWTDETVRVEVARSVLAAKLQNSYRLVRRWSRDLREPRRGSVVDRAELIRDRLQRMRTASSRAEMLGIEGDAARAYFRVLAMVLADTDTPFRGRSRRPPLDVPNSLLSFVYGLLTSELVGACEAVGLDPQIGLLHDHRPGRPALAVDLLEEFRAPFADRLVVSALRRRQLGPHDCERLPGGMVRLTDDGRRRLLSLFDEARAVEHHHPVLGRHVPRWSLPHVQASLMARFVRGDVPAYAPFVMEG